MPNFVVNLECFATKYGILKKLDKFAIQTTEFGRNFSLSGAGYKKVTNNNWRQLSALFQYYMTDRDICYLLLHVS